MSVWTKSVFSVVLLGVSLGCAGMGGMGGGSYANQAACTKWIEASNALPCMKMVQQDAAQICPSTLDLTPMDMTSYYDCMRTNAKCNGDIPDLAGQANCTPATP